MPNTLIPALLLLLATPWANAMPELVVDTYRSSIDFTVRATGHEVEGHVISFSTRIRFARRGDFPYDARVRFDVTALTTQHEERDREMLGWLEADRFPEIVFEMDEMAGTGNTRVIEGSLTLHGVTRGISIPVTITTTGERTTIMGETAIDSRNFRLPKIRRALVVSVSPTILIEFILVGKVE